MILTDVEIMSLYRILDHICLGEDDNGVVRTSIGEIKIEISSVWGCYLDIDGKGLIVRGEDGPWWDYIRQWMADATERIKREENDAREKRDSRIRDLSKRFSVNPGPPARIEFAGIRPEGGDDPINNGNAATASHWESLMIMLGFRQEKK